MVPEPLREPEVNKLFRMAMKHDAIHLYIEVGLAPRMQLKGRIRDTLIRPPSQEDMERLLYPLMNKQHRKKLDENGTVGFVHVVGKDECRFLCFVSKKNGQLSMAARSLEGT